MENGISSRSLRNYTTVPVYFPSSIPPLFSAERAMDHVPVISQEPHVTGSPEIHKVRDYILGELTSLGFKAETQLILEQYSLRDDEVALVENVLARIPGKNPSGSIVFMGHYDSAPHSPGAGDDGEAVAVMIETARALAAGPPWTMTSCSCFPMLKNRQSAVLTPPECIPGYHRIVIWQEGGVPVLEGDEAALVERGRNLAREEGIYLLMGIVTLTKDFPDVLAGNKLIWMTPSGDVQWDYFKGRPVPGEPVIAGDGQIPVGQTPYGIIGSVICFDMDHPAYMRPAGRNGTDVMLAPSWDWQEIDPLHTRMAALRGIENGFSVARATGDGLSAAFDIANVTILMHSFRSESILPGCRSLLLRQEGHWPPAR
jgi:hypothetical protein